MIPSFSSTTAKMSLQNVPAVWTYSRYPYPMAVFTGIGFLNSCTILILPSEPRMTDDAPAVAVPADISVHTDVELAGVLAENIVVLSVNEDTDYLWVLEDGVHSPTLLFWGMDDLWLLEADVLLEFLDAFVRPLDFPEMLWLS